MSIKRFIFIKVALLYFISNSFGQGFIIDHNAVQKFDEIPEAWLDSAKALTMHYAHRSHGMQIISGLKYLYENVDSQKYNVSYRNWQNDPNLPPDNGQHRICSCDWQPDDYWATEGGQSNTRRFADSGLFDFSMFAWCGELSTSQDKTEYIDEYLNTMDMFEKEYPNMRFIYQTGNTDGDPSWSRLKQHNNQIREYCKENNKILFDFADIESWDPEGNFYPDNYGCSWCEDWCNEHPLEYLPEECNSGLPTCCPHTHGYNCYIKGKAYWYMLAVLAGWDGGMSSLRDKVRNDNKYPEKFILGQNYPNPFNTFTRIPYQLMMGGGVELIIYDINSREIYRFEENYIKPGSYYIDWNARNFSSGKYIYQLRVDNLGLAKSLILIK